MNIKRLKKIGIKMPGLVSGLNPCLLGVKSRVVEINVG